jgi:hypothetical protein
MAMGTDLIVSNADLATTVASYVEQAKDLKVQAERAEITTVDESGRGADFLKIVKGLTKRADEYRKGLIDPYNRRIKVINTEIKKISEPLTEATKIVNKKVLDFAVAEQKRQEAERKRIEDEAAQAALDAAEEADQSGHPEVADQILELAVDSEAPPPSAPTARGELTGAASSVRYTWVGEVRNLKHLCQAVADGNLPETLVKEISQTELNRLAREHGARASDDATEIAQHGIVYFQKAGLSTR